MTAAAVRMAMAPVLRASRSFRMRSPRGTRRGSVSIVDLQEHGIGAAGAVVCFIVLLRGVGLALLSILSRPPVMLVLKTGLPSVIVLSTLHISLKAFPTYFSIVSCLFHPTYTCTHSHSIPHFNM